MSRIVNCPACGNDAEGYDNPNIKHCRVCWRENAKRWRQAHRANIARYQAKKRAKYPEKLRAICRKSWNKNKEKYNRARKLGGTSLYDEMFAVQGGLCAICHQPEKSKRYKTLCVDHCHATKEIRGLLCSHCNRGLGLFGDSADVLASAVQYLQRSN